MKAESKLDAPRGDVVTPIAQGTAITVVVPTYREALNLPGLMERLGRLRETHALDLDVLLMDDDSPDDTADVVRRLALPWVRLVVRKTDRGLSPAVLDGVRLATKDVIVVMDADLSHPPEAIPRMLAALETSEFVIGSRYVAGGGTAEDWGFLRWINSKIATWLARPFTNSADPMAGFFAFRKALLQRAGHLNPIGYKIGLEILVKCRVERVAEVPIQFAQRELGESKLNFAEQLRYIQHLRRLFIFKYPTWSNILQFAVVGATGLLVNLVVLTALLAVAVPTGWAVAAAIAVSMVGNFVLNRRFTFSHARHGSLVKQFVGFVAACSLGALVNYYVTTTVLAAQPDMLPQLAATIGVVAGTVVNFVINMFVVFKK
jgi:dolichol-phosphate mannosyltransferase